MKCTYVVLCHEKIKFEENYGSVKEKNKIKKIKKNVDKTFLLLFFKRKRKILFVSITNIFQNSNQLEQMNGFCYFGFFQNKDFNSNYLSVKWWIFSFFILKIKGLNVSSKVCIRAYFKNFFFS